jgi:hypothetical protein
MPGFAELRWNCEIVRAPLLIARGLFRVGGKPVAFNAFDGKPRDILEGNVQDRMFRHRGMTVSHHPFLVELGRFFVAQLRGNRAE